MHSPCHAFLVPYINAFLAQCHSVCKCRLAVRVLEEILCHVLAGLQMMGLVEKYYPVTSCVSHPV